MVLGNRHVHSKLNVPLKAYERHPVPFKTLVPVETTPDFPVPLEPLVGSGIADFAYFSDFGPE